MNDNQNFFEGEEVVVLVDEDGNEIIEEPEEFLEAEDVAADLSEGEVILEDEYELEQTYVEDEDVEDEEYDDGDGGFFGNISNKILYVFGGLIAVAAIFVGIFLITSKSKGGEVDFSMVGSQIAEIGVVGNENIRAIAAAKGSYIDDINEAIKAYDYNEADLEGGITSVDFSLQTIVKDLKIKFVNSNDKLIASVPFEVEVTGPDGKTTTWTDTDKDGIIYQTDIAGGSYSVKLVALSGYDALYDFSKAGSSKSISVKTKLDYQKVDVKNEIKVQNSSNQAEDAVLKETVVESKLKDTVSYVMSSKTATSGYTEVGKDTLIDPLATLTKSYEASVGRFKRLSGPVNVDHVEHEPQWGEWEQNDADTHIRRCTYEGCTETETESHSFDGDTCSVCNYTRQSEDPAPTCEHPDSKIHYKYVDTGMHKATCECGEVVFESESCEYPEHWVIDSETTTRHYKACKKCGEKKYEDCVDANNDGTCDICGRTGMALKPVEISGSASITPSATTPLNLSNNKTVKLTAGTKIDKGSEDVDKYEYTWSIASGDAVKLPENKNTSDITVTAQKTGEATIQLVVKLTRKGAGDPVELKQTYKVTVGAVTVKLNKTSKKALFIGGDTYEVKAEVAGGKDNTVEWNYNKDLVDVKVSEDTRTITLTAKKAGDFELYAKSKDDTNVISEKVKIIVANHPKNDASTKLTDKSGKQVFVYDDASKSYREATYADYYKSGVKFFLPADVVYTYTGWWTIDGKSYYFDANGKKVTGDQVILGAKYSFDSNGVLKSGTGSFGIDVSTFNGTIDWSKVAKSGVSFAIIRCGLRGSSAGALYEDAKFATNIKNATSAGVKVGLYFFTQAVSEAEAVEEASMCLTLAENYKISYPIFIDVESASNGRANGLSKSDRTKIVNAFCKTITNGGYKAGIYANKTWFTNNMDVSQLTSYVIWLAQYASSPTYTASRYDLWQYSSEGSLSGISGNVDLDLSYLGY